MAKPYRRRDSKFWWISPVISGIQKPQSTKTTDYQEALDMLRRLEGKIADGLITVHTGRVLFRDLLDLLKRDYKIKKRRSETDVLQRINKHLDGPLGDFRAASINASTITEYVERRIEQNASNATINRELAVIKRAFNLGRKAGLVATCPYIESLPEDNVRQGFFNEEHFRAVLRHAKPILRDVLIVAYYTGWRIDSILHLEWSNVDLAHNVIRLRPNQTKNRKGTTFPIEPFPELRAALDSRRYQDRAALITPWVFQRKGKRVTSIRRAWVIARAKANVPGRLIHDFRRTAVRELTRLGFTPSEVMNMVGIKTMSIYLRYQIITEHDILTKAASLTKAQHGLIASPQN